MTERGTWGVFVQEIEAKGSKKREFLVDCFLEKNIAEFATHMLNAEHDVIKDMGYTFNNGNTIYYFYCKFITSIPIKVTDGDICHLIEYLKGEKRQEFVSKTAMKLGLDDTLYQNSRNRMFHRCSSAMDLATEIIGEKLLFGK